MKKRKCVVCGRTAPTEEFGDGIRCPKTTCLICQAVAGLRREEKITMQIKRVLK